MSNKDPRTKQYLVWDYYQERAISKNILNKVSKFHQLSTTLHFPSMTLHPNPDVIRWINQVEKTDVLPNHFGYSFNLDPAKNDIEGSDWKFDKNYQFSRTEISNILYSAFGRNSETKSKNYPSAGGLYPIFPVVYVLSENAIEGLNKTGCYIFDPVALDLKLIKAFDSFLIKKFKGLLINNGEILSHTLIGYAIDIKRAIIKYRVRGYRYALIEVGLMAQSLKFALRDEGDFGQLCWGGFNDNALTHLSGLNVKLSPIVLLQWFGKRGSQKSAL